jgi:decaprenyl-phosphate phosphoribosyltransferase
VRDPLTVGAPEAAEPPGRRKGPAAERIHGIVALARPRQWAKNVLVFSAAGTAGVLSHRAVATKLGFAFVILCVLSAGTYFLNDLLDMDADRVHPTKRHRPLPSGRVSPVVARWLGMALIAAAIAAAPVFVNGAFLLACLAYLALSLGYSMWLRNIEVVDMCAIASGFVLRAVAGGLAVDVPLSRWFLIVASFGSLFMVAGKRLADIRMTLPDRDAHRRTLAGYSERYLAAVLVGAATITVTAYCLWAFERTGTSSIPWFEISILPLVMGVLRYGLLVERGHGGAPEDVVWSDRPLQLIGAGWALLIALGVYVR